MDGRQTGNFCKMATKWFMTKCTPSIAIDKDRAKRSPSKNVVPDVVNLLKIIIWNHNQIHVKFISRKQQGKSPCSTRRHNLWDQQGPRLDQAEAIRREEGQQTVHAQASVEGAFSTSSTQWLESLVEKLPFWTAGGWGIPLIWVIIGAQLK